MWWIAPPPTARARGNGTRKGLVGCYFHFLDMTWYLTFPSRPSGTPARGRKGPSHLSSVKIHSSLNRASGLAKSVFIGVCALALSRFSGYATDLTTLINYRMRCSDRLQVSALYSPTLTLTLKLQLNTGEGGGRAKHAGYRFEISSKQETSMQVQL